MAIEEDLKKNIKEFLESAEDDLQKERYNSSISSFFKAIAVMCDLKIYQDKRILPKNHAERFLFLKTDYKESYLIVSLLFQRYKDSYNLRIKKNDALEVKKNVERIRAIFRFKED